MQDPILDLDDPDTWHSEFTGLIDSHWCSIDAELGATAGTSVWQLMRGEVCDQNQLGGLLQKEAVGILCTRYSYVMAYHGCRVRDTVSYTSRGILQSNPACLATMARELFCGIDGFDDALRDLTQQWGSGQSYAQWNHGKVGLLLSGERARSERCGFAGGSEFMRAIANRLGKEAKRRFVQTGRPALIKCKIPVDWLDMSTTFPVKGSYSNDVLFHLIGKRRDPTANPVAQNGGYLLTRTVPADHVLNFIDMTDIINDNAWINS